jgi:hypothetical protein
MTSDLPSRLFGAFAALGLAACASAGSGAAQPPTAGDTAGGTAGLYRQIREQIGPAACSADVQCHTLAVGHKACGGPEAYLVWSSQTQDGTRLRVLADAYAQARQAEDRQSGRVSDCSMVADPGARCEAGRCVPARRPPPVMQ